MSDAVADAGHGSEIVAELETVVGLVDLRTDGIEAPDNVDRHDPLLSWRLQSVDGRVSQTAYRLRLAADPAVLLDGATPVWDSGRVESSSSIGVSYAGPRLAPCTRYWWSVRIWDADGAQSAWAEPATFRTALLSDGAWSTPWITAPADRRLSVGPGRVFYLSHDFELDADPESAYLYATAKGIYRAHLNGSRVELGEQAPGWTTYERRFHYQVADVTELLERGRNRLSLAVADGWWVGNIAWWGRQLYGDHTAVSLELRIRNLDGSEQTVATGPDWTVGLGRVVDSDLLMGETQDLRLPDLEPVAPLGTAEIEPATAARVIAQLHEPMAVIESLAPASVISRGPGVTVLDFGQHLTGRVRLRVRGGRPGDVVTVRHAEALMSDGSLYTANLRTARQEDRFVLGGGDETIVPQFVLHGFRYAEVQGHPGRIDESDVEVEVVHSDLPTTCRFRSANPLADRLHRNVVWSQRANFIDIPVDCAQRDERLGWTGDINLFTPTALVTMDSARFLRSWLRSLADAQQPNGAVPDVAPYRNQPLPPRDINEGQPGWGDAIVEMPWQIYLHTGDHRVLEENWRPIVRWLDYLTAGDRPLIRSVGVFGDWNALGTKTPSELLGTVWFARAARAAASAARALGHDEAAREYADLYGAIRAAFQERFVDRDGSIDGGTQTAYATALDAGLVPDELVDAAGARLLGAIADNGWHLTTGFVGTASVLNVLAALGRADVAYRVLAQATFPSWGFQLLNGATAMWEHWDSWRPETGFQDPKMNSFNHFAFASVGGWLHRVAAGINPDPERPGYRHVRFAPHPDTWLREVSLELDAPTGRVASAWWTDGRRARLTVTVPPNADGSLELPWVSDPAAVVVAVWSAAGEVVEANQGVRVLLGPGTSIVQVPHPPRDSSDAG